MLWAVGRIYKYTPTTSSTLHHCPSPLHLSQIFLGWVATLFIACGISAGITAFGAYSPYQPINDQLVSAAIVSGPGGKVDVSEMRGSRG